MDEKGEKLCCNGCAHCIEDFDGYCEYCDAGFSQYDVVLLPVFRANIELPTHNICFCSERCRDEYQATR